MGDGIDTKKKPLIFISRASSESQDISIKSIDSEPEMEEFNEEVLVKNLFKELDMGTDPNEHSDIFMHKINSNNECFHCKLQENLQKLKQQIDTINNEICTVHEAAHMKKEQNLELKNTIKRLENSLGRGNDTLLLEKK